VPSPTSETEERRRLDAERVRETVDPPADAIRVKEGGFEMGGEEPEGEKTVGVTPPRREEETEPMEVLRRRWSEEPLLLLVWPAGSGGRGGKGRIRGSTGLALAAAWR
jgi:hypothetical protein